ncbi:MAG: type VI secretion system baseplate subunit TssE [Alphaproteobacteria bacterium]|nr:type VI secretion system baseplate subunit TssE [Alphaproteobacteria bacterium]
MGASRAKRAQLPLLDRLIDADPTEKTDRPLSASAAMDAVRISICNDLEELLNTRRRWRSWDPGLSQLDQSLVGFGLPDFASGAFNDPRRREELRLTIESCIRRFEPRIVSLKVTLAEATDKQSGTLRLRIDALLHAEPAPEPIAFDTVVDLLTKNVTVLEQET